MQTRTVGIAVSLSVFIGIGFLLWQQPSSTTSAESSGNGIIGNVETSNDPYDVAITYTGDGFSPREITIVQGARVRFLNESADEPFWPASNVHPTHVLYPEKDARNCLGSSFDACKPLWPGEYYDFTLYQVGAWPFHDHQHASHTGSVTVTSEAVPSR